MNPFDLAGPQFLVFYLAFGGCVLVAAQFYSSGSRIQRLLKRYSHRSLPHCLSARRKERGPQAWNGIAD